jgi:hypothetical protein
MKRKGDNDSMKVPLEDAWVSSRNDPDGRMVGYCLETRFYLRCKFGYQESPTAALRQQRNLRTFNRSQSSGTLPANIKFVHMPSAYIAGELKSDKPPSDSKVFPTTKR